MSKQYAASVLVSYLQNLMKMIDNLEGYERATRIIRGYIAVAEWIEQESESSRFSFIISRGLVSKLKAANECLTRGDGIATNFDPVAIERVVKPVLVKALEEAEFIASLNCDEIEDFRKVHYVQTGVKTLME